MGQVVVLGLIAGGIYAIFAVGIVLLYRGTGVLNFAGGELGTAGLFVASFLVTDHGAPWIVGAICAVLFVALVAAAFEFLLVRRSVDADPVATSILTVGLALTLFATEMFFYGQTPEKLRAPIAGGVELFNFVVGWHSVIALALALALGLGLQALLRRTDFGLGVLAAAQDPAAVRLVGVPLSKVRLSVWVGSGALAAVAALLVEPTVTNFTPGFASTLYLDALAAAVLGRLTSLPGAVAGGVVIGLAEAVCRRYQTEIGIPGVEYVAVLVVLLVALLGRSLWPELRKRLESPSLRPTEVAA
jgi:branched-chain amino acid transport system permease protein